MANVNLLTDVHIPDDTKLTFGDSSGPDIEIYYDSAGTDTGKYISGPKTGTFYIQNEAQSDVRIRCQGASGGTNRSTLFVTSSGFSFSSDASTTIQMDDTGLIFPDTLTAITKHKNGTDGSLPFKYKNLSNSTTTTTAELFRDKFKFHQDIELDADLIDINGNTGTAGQVLSSLGTGNGVDWITPSSGTVTGSGTAGRVAFWNGGSSITSDPDLTFDNINLTCGGVYLASTGTKSAPSYTFTGDSNTGMFQDGADVLGFTSGGDVKIRVTSSGLGVTDDIYHHGDSDTKISFGTNTIDFDAGGTTHIDISSAGSRFGTSARFTSGATFDTNSKAIFGDSSNLEIYSDGSRSFITDTNDDLVISAADNVNIEVQGSETAIGCVGNGKVSLYYNNTERWETLSDGAGTDGDIIETISNGGGKRIGFNVGDSFTHNSNTIAHYGISNAGNATDGGIVLSGYFGLKFATNGVVRATIQNDGDTALLSHTLVSGFDENNASTSYYYIPLAGSITEGTSSQYYRTFACPQAGRVVSIMMMHTSGSAVSLNTYTTQLRVIKNGSTAATSSELSANDGNNDGSYIEYTPDVDFSKGDRLGFQFSKSNTAMRWRGASVTIMIELDDYNL
tara:strand:- start:585 stop:2444 length:1860 start_codon:yes stop_codon:yes gene_type:complete